jgi:hypothetical protein
MVNNILKRLRERTVTNVSDNEYSALIGVLINDAKREVEDAWDWSALRTTLTATTSAGVYSYELNGSQNNIKVLDVINDTDDIFMRYADAHWMNQMFLTTTPQTGSPYYYSFNGVSSDGDTQVDIYPIPDGAYTVRFNAIQRTAELSANSDQVLIPYQAILLLAYAKAIEERGEDGGVNSSSAYATAQRALNDAIAFDAAKHPEELIWQEV